MALDPDHSPAQEALAGQALAGMTVGFTNFLDLFLLTLPIF